MQYHRQGGRRETKRTCRADRFTWPTACALIAGTQLTPKRIALLVTSALWASFAYGQTATPGVPGTAASPVTTGAVPPAQPTATGLIQGNPATPQPLPDLADNMALPAQRGFIRAEPVFIYPSLGVSLGYDDNLTGVHDNRISSAFVMLFPRVRADIKKGSDTYAG